VSARGRGRRRGRGGGKTQAGRVPARTAAWARRGLPWLGLALVVAIAAAWLVQRRLPSGGAAGSVPPLPGPVRALSPEAAYQQASALIRSDPEDALPYLRRAADDPSLGLLVHLAYATAHGNLAYRTIARRGLPGPEVRTSWERMRLMRAALDELARAAALAETPAQQAEVHANRARVDLAWGLPWDALEEIRAAARLDPAGWQPIADEARLRLMDPVRFTPETTTPQTPTEAGTRVPTPVTKARPPSAGR
jgi:hypothetical protein